MYIKCGSLRKCMELFPLEFALHRNKNISVCTKKEGLPMTEISNTKTTD
jgi:hypothetical protein